MKKVKDMTVEAVRKALNITSEDAELLKHGNFVHCFEPGCEYPTPEEKTEQAKTFNPWHFFDKGCPHCTPFVNEGAVLLYRDEGTMLGMRFVKGDAVETVMLKDTEAYRKAKAAAAGAN